MKKVCAITMVRNDAFFLKKWVAYYGALLGEENLYVYLDGADQEIPNELGKTNIQKCVRMDAGVVKGDKRRIAFLSNRAKELFDQYELVIGCDVDEFLVVDPRLGISLPEYLSMVKCDPSVSALGMDVGQNMKYEKKYDSSLSFLSQRGYALVCPRYTKSVVLSKPVEWGSGFHRTRHHNYRIDANLYLFHFGTFDKEMIEARFNDQDRIRAGWGRHIRKRMRTIWYVTHLRSMKGDCGMRLARVIQTICRPIYAWNKPTMYKFKIVVRIPQRFNKIV